MVSVSFFRNISYYTLANAVIRVLSLIIPLVAVKYLEAEQYYSLIICIATSNLIISTLGHSLGVASNKCSANIAMGHKVESSTSFLSMVKFFLLFVLVLFVLLYGLRGYLFSDELNNTKLYLVTLYNSVVGVCSAVLVNYYIGKGKVNEISMLQTICGSVALLLLFLMFFSNSEVDSPVLFGLFLSLPFSFFVLVIIAKNNKELLPVFINKSESKDYHYLNKIVIPSLFSNFSYAISVWVVLIIIGNGLSTVAASKYATAMIFVNLSMYIPQLTSAVTVPLLMKLTEKRKLFKALKKIIVLNLIISIVFLLIMLLSRNWIDSYFSESYRDFSTFVLLLMVAVIPISVCNAFGQLLVRVEKLNVAFVFNIIWAIIYIIGVLASVYIFEKLSVLPFIMAYFILFIVQGVYVGFEFKENR